MIDDFKCIYRDATINDIAFLAEAIIEAKKGGSDKCGMANLFELSEVELGGYISQMLEEEIDGCDFSISSFIVAEHEGIPVATFGGWIEGMNEDEMPSAMLKSNLIGFVIPAEHVKKAQEKSTLVSDLQIEREFGTYQLEYGYTKPEYRGHHLIGQLIEKHVERAKASSMPVKKMQVLLYDNNAAALSAYMRAGFRIIQRLEASDKEVLKYYPHDKELFLEKTI